MTLYFTERFKKQYRGLPRPVQKKLDRQIRFLAVNPRHPSLQSRKLIEDIWYFRVDLAHRATFQLEGDVLILRNVDRHDKALGNP